MCGEQLCGKLSSNCVDSVEWRYVASGRPVSLCQLGSVSALTRYKGDLPLCLWRYSIEIPQKNRRFRGQGRLKGGPLIFQHSSMFLGKDGAIKSDEFSEKSQTGFDPPSFTDHYVAKFV